MVSGGTHGPSYTALRNTQHSSALNSIPKYGAPAHSAHVRAVFGSDSYRGRASLKFCPRGLSGKGDG
eukprot:8348532-Pyramimonas_sp.AAC.1